VAGEALQMDVVTYAPTVLYHCQHCELTFQQMGIGDKAHRQQARESLPDDLRADFHRLSDWIHHLRDRYGERIRVRVVDAASLQGFWASLRFRTARYPFVVVDGRRRHVGTDFERVEPIIEELIDGRRDHTKGGEASLSGS
jgi:hypothetical protein